MDDYEKWLLTRLEVLSRKLVGAEGADVDFLNGTLAGIGDALERYRLFTAPSTITELGVPKVVVTMFTRAGLTDVTHIGTMSRVDILKVPGIGPKRSAVLEDALAVAGHKVK
ncbi:MAG: hypothetical protein ACOYD1_07860 [Candidatus Nanopelagicales bacterium]